MEFNKLIEDFGARHKVENLVAVDGAAAERAESESPSFASPGFMQV